MRLCIAIMMDVPRKTKMKTGQLLENLIQISKKSKTDFALSLNMTPSGLSKLLSGNRLPALKERKVFAEKAGAYFAEAIFSVGSYVKFADIFPVIYDFKSQHELQGFLSYAIEYILDQDLAADSGIDLNYSERSFSYLGRRTVLNNICVFLSSCFMRGENKPLELYASFPLVDPIYADTISRIIVVNPQMVGSLTFNYIFHDDMLQARDSMGKNPFLSFISSIQQNFNLNLWKTQSKIAQPFILLKNRSLLLFNELLDRTPVLLPITHKSYLNTFYFSLMRMNMKKMSYSRSESTAFLKANPHFMDKSFLDGVSFAYSFTSIGFFFQKEELIAAGADPDIAAIIADLFHHILHGESTFIVSIGALERFRSIGQSVVPMIGAIHYDLDERMSYRNKVDTYLGNKAIFEKIKATDSSLFNLAVLCTPQFCFIYSTNDACTRERIHVLGRDLIFPMLEKETTINGKNALDSSGELWAFYVRS